LGWITNTVSIGWFSEYLGIKGSYNLHQLFFGLQPMGPGGGPPSTGFKPKLYHAMEGNKSGGGSTGTSGTSGSSGTSGTSATWVSPNISVLLRGLGFADSSNPANSSTMIIEMLTRKGVNNIFGPQGKLANIAIQGVKLTDSELQALTMATNMLDNHWKSLSPEQQVSQDKINRAIFFHNGIVDRERTAEAANSLLALQRNNNK
jgi:hypothetical protein